MPSGPQRATVQQGDSGGTVQGRLLRMLRGTGADKQPLPCFILLKTNHRTPLAEAKLYKVKTQRTRDPSEHFGPEIQNSFSWAGRGPVTGWNAKAKASLGQLD